MKLARLAAPYAVKRLIQLMDSEDERVAAVACNAILDRALDKPKVAEEVDDLAARLEAMTPAERLTEAEKILAGAVRYLPLLEQAERERAAASEIQVSEADQPKIQAPELA